MGCEMIRGGDSCNKNKLSATNFFCDNIISYHQTIAAELTVISLRYKEPDFSDILKTYFTGMDYQYEPDDILNPRFVWLA